MTIQSTDELRDTAIRETAIAQLRKKRELQAHLIAYGTVNLLIIGIWYATMPGGFFWPMFPLLGWGSGSSSTSGTCTRRRPSARTGSSGRCAG